VPGYRLSRPFGTLHCSGGFRLVAPIEGFQLPIPRTRFNIPFGSETY
jgi:hypothetical protein